MKVWYIKLHRSSEDNVLYFSEPFTKRQARSDLLMTTAFKDWAITVRWNIIEVKRWQNGYSEDSLAGRWQRSRGKVRRFLDYLETIQQIVQHKSKVKSIITIKNYDKYQWNDTTDSTTDGQQTDTIKKYNKKKEWKNIIDDLIDDFISMRKKGKKAMTDRAIDLFMNRLEKLSWWNEEYKIKMLENAIVWSRSNIYELKDNDKLEVVDPTIKEYDKQTQICADKWRSDDRENNILMEKRKQLESKYWKEKAMEIRKEIRAKYK